MDCLDDGLMTPEDWGWIKKLPVGMDDFDVVGDSMHNAKAWHRIVGSDD
jgi:hypothetical protein